MYSSCSEILNHLKTTVTLPVTTLVPGININLDEPINLVFSDLPSLSLYPIREDFMYDEGFTADMKHLLVRFELRMKKGPASLVCTPVINAIVTALKADPKVGGHAQYQEFQTIQWANEDTGSGTVCGASLDIQINYFAAQ